MNFQDITTAFYELVVKPELSQEIVTEKGETKRQYAFRRLDDSTIGFFGKPEDRNLMTKQEVKQLIEKYVTPMKNGGFVIHNKLDRDNKTIKFYKKATSQGNVFVHPEQ